MDHQMSVEDLQTVTRVRDALGSGRAEAARIAANVSLAEAAAAGHCAVSALRKWERGERTPRAARALAYAPVLAALEQEVSQ